MDLPNETRRDPGFLIIHGHDEHFAAVVVVVVVVVASCCCELCLVLKLIRLSNTT